MNNIKSRNEVARFIEKQFEEDPSGKPDKGGPHGQWHYGVQDLRQLMDFIYGGKPLTADEMVRRWKWSADARTCVLE